MSHRITTEAKITNPELFKDIAAKEGFQLSTNGPTRARVSKFHHTMDVDYTTGNLSGDSDHMDDFNPLVRAYTIANYRWELQRAGHQVLNEETDHEGNLVITFQTHG